MGMGCRSSKVAEPARQEKSTGTLLTTQDVKTTPRTDPLVFAPGSIGIEANWESGVVTSIAPGGQAERLGVKEGWQFHTLQEGGISEPYSKDRLDEFAAGRQCYCLIFTKSPASALEGTDATQAPSNEKVEVGPQPEQALEVATSAEMKTAAAAEEGNTERVDFPVEIEVAAKCEDQQVAAKCEDQQAPAVEEHAVTVSAPAEAKGIFGFACCG